MGLGPVEAGWQRLSPHLDAAARTLGAGPFKLLRAVHVPLLRPALGAAALLVFIALLFVGYVYAWRKGALEWV